MKDNLEHGWLLRSEPDDPLIGYCVYCERPIYCYPHKVDGELICDDCYNEHYEEDDLDNDNN